MDTFYHKNCKHNHLLSLKILVDVYVYVLNVFSSHNTNGMPSHRSYICMEANHPCESYGVYAIFSFEQMLFYTQYMSRVFHQCAPFDDKSIEMVVKNVFHIYHMNELDFYLSFLVSYTTEVFPDFQHLLITKKKFKRIFRKDGMIFSKIDFEF